MAIRAKTVILSILALFVLIVFVGISMIGWAVILGPKARAVTDRKFPATPETIARGQYLANGGLHCFFCHTEHDLTTPDFNAVESKQGAGWTMPIPELNNIAARNITPDVETGIGSWTDDEIARAIQEGIRKDGSALFPVMPYMEFSHLDDQDVGAIVVYLRTLKPVHNVVPKRNLPFPLEYIVKTIPKPLAARQTSHPSATAEQRGKYLVDAIGCGGCHSATDDKGDPLPGLAFGGGLVFKDPGQGGKEIFSANITQDASGIPHYDEALFLQMMHTGSASNRKLHPIMPTMYFKNMTDDDLRDVWAFVKTVPPVKHRINNSDPPTPCPLCKQSHGLGNLNVAATK